MSNLIVYKNYVIFLFYIHNAIHNTEVSYYNYFLKNISSHAVSLTFKIAQSSAKVSK